MCDMTALERTRRLLVAIVVAMQTLQHAAATHDISIVLRPQGTLEISQNATAAVVCKVQRNNSENFLTFFTWNGNSLSVGDPHFNSGLLKTVFTECVTDAGHVCEKFELIVKGDSAANGSTVGCFISRNSSTTVHADGHVQIMVTGSESGTSVTPSTVTIVAPSPTPTVTTVTSPSLGSTSSGTDTDMTIDITPSPTGVSRGSPTEGVLSMMLVTALLTVTVTHLL